MSSSDQAKSKLLDSMRMSKQGSSDAPVAEKPAQAKAAPAKTAPAPKKSKAATKTAAAKKPVIDNFQAAQRVWPD